MKKKRNIAFLTKAISGTFFLTAALSGPLSVHASIASGLYFQQVQTVKGKVISEQDKQPVPGAAVQIKGTSKGTVTNENGEFTIQANTGDILMISSIGFTAQEIAVAAGKSYDVTLAFSNTSLDEVVVTGYSAQRVKDLTGAVAVVNVNQMKQQPVASPVESLQGKATGVQIISDGAPGATPQIRIRGFSTINNNDPLFVIDGVPYEGKLSWLDQNDIETMQVLKDASSASIYGARANNGVVIITTRQGVKGPPKINLSSYFGTQVPNKNAFPKMMNPQQYAEYVYEAFRNSGQTPGQEGTTGNNYGTGATPTLPEYLVAGKVTGQKVTAADADPSRYNYSRASETFYQITKANKQGTNWFDEISQTAPIRNVQLGVNGGGDNATYAIGAGYLGQKGTIRHTGYNRYNGRANTRFSAFNNHFRFGENMQYSYEEFVGVGVNPNVSGDYQGEGSALGFAYRIPVIIPVYDIMGNFAGSRGDKLGNAQNPLALLYRAKDNVQKRNFFFGNVFGEVDLVKGLVAKTSFGLRYENYSGISLTYPNLEFSEGSAANGMSENQGFNTEWTWTNTLTYKWEVANVHSLTVLAGTEAFRSRNRFLSAGRNDYFLLGQTDYYYLPAGASNINNTSSGGVGSLFSIFGRADYSFRDRYLVSLTVRRDGSSNFSKNSRYGTFPAGSIAWRLSEEDFLKGNKFITDLKLRAGYGITGNQRIPAFQYIDRYESLIANAFYPFNGKSVTGGVWQKAYKNENVKWEELKSFNIGLDFTLLDGEFDGAIDWYSRKTTDMLYPVPMPAASIGMGGAPFVNIGDMKNTGIELGLGYHYGQRENKPFKLDVNVNISRNVNQVVSLAPSVKEQVYGTFRSLQTTILRPGEPFGSFYGYKWDGVYTSADDLAKSPKYSGARVGGPKYIDVTGDGQITPADRTIIGNPHPDFLYSFGINAKYKSWDLAMFFNGSQGNDLYEATRYFTDFSTFDGTASVRMLDRWSPSNPNSRTHTPNRKASDYELASSGYYVQDGSYFRMKNLQIGYNFKVDNWFKGNMRTLRAYVGASNLFTLTKYTGLDPEVSQTNSTFSALGVDFGVYPVSRQFLIGFSAGF